MPNLKKEVFELNGYRLIFEPQHPRALTKGAYKGYVYEHIAVATQMLGRPLRDDEIVHHLDQNRANNRVENLLVLLRSQHAKLHVWADSATSVLTHDGVKTKTALRHKVVVPTYCQSCGRCLQAKQKNHCSLMCSSQSRRRVARPSKKQLEDDLATMSWVAVGRKYGVTDNAVRKWARNYGLLATAVPVTSKTT
jgi:hypothetical protein